MNEDETLFLYTYKHIGLKGSATLAYQYGIYHFNEFLEQTGNILYI